MMRKGNTINIEKRSNSNQFNNIEILFEIYLNSDVIKKNTELLPAANRFNFIFFA